MPVPLPRVGLVCTLICAASASGLFAAVVKSPEELHQRLRTAQPGDVIALAAGQWRDVDLVLEAQGRPDRPIIITAERPGETILTGRSRVRVGGEYLVLSGWLFREAWFPGALLELRRDSRRHAAHCRITECAFIDCNPPDGSGDEGKYLSLYGQHHRVDHCYFAGKRSRGATLVVWLDDETSGRHQIDFNHFGPRPELRQNGGETIRIGDSQTSLWAARCVVDSNLFEECNGEVEIISNKSCENIYRHNTFRRCAGTLTLRHGHRCLVEGNWFLGEGARNTGGVRIIGEGHRVVNNYFADLEGRDARAAVCVMSGLIDSPLHGYSPVAGATIAFNTLVNCRESLVIGYGDKDVQANAPPRECVIVNNLLVSRRGPLVCLVTPPEGFRWSTNLLHGAASGLTDEHGQILAEPRLTAASDGTFRPGADSPARGAADDRLVAVADDIDGQRRTAPWDVGCDQLSGEPVLFRPLTSTDVGPFWMRRRTEEPRQP